MSASDYLSPSDLPSFEEIEAMEGRVVLQFGTSWCGFCQAAEPLIQAALTDQQGLRHLKIEDGQGRSLGRAFSIKLWPTLVFLLDGKEYARIVRPTSVSEINQTFESKH